MGEGFHVPVHVGLHLIVKGEHAALFQHPQGLPQQGPLVRARDIVVDIVAHHGVETLIREIQLVRVPMLEYAPGRRALACGVFLAHGLAVAVGRAPIVDAGDRSIRPGQRRPDAQRPGAAAHLYENTPIEELHLSDEVVELLKSERFNNRLLCEIISHEKFKELLADAEIYVDGIATMHFHDTNSSLAALRAMILEEHPEATADRAIKILEACQVEEEDFFCHVTHKTWDAILHDIRKAHENDMESAPDTTPADELIKEVRKAMQSTGDRVQEFLEIFCKAFQLKYKRLTDEERTTLKRLFKRSPLIKNSGINFRRRPWK